MTGASQSERSVVALFCCCILPARFFGQNHQGHPFLAIALFFLKKILLEFLLPPSNSYACVNIVHADRRDKVEGLEGHPKQELLIREPISYQNVFQALKSRDCSFRVVHNRVVTPSSVKQIRGDSIVHQISLQAITSLTLRSDQNQKGVVRAVLHLVERLSTFFSLKTAQQDLPPSKEGCRRVTNFKCRT